MSKLVGVPFNDKITLDRSRSQSPCTVQVFIKLREVLGQSKAKLFNTSRHRKQIGGGETCGIQSQCRD